MPESGVMYDILGHTVMLLCDKIILFFLQGRSISSDRKALWTRSVWLYGWFLCIISWNLNKDYQFSIRHFNQIRFCSEVKNVVHFFYVLPLVIDDHKLQSVTFTNIRPNKVFLTCPNHVWSSKVRLIFLCEL